MKNKFILAAILAAVPMLPAMAASSVQQCDLCKALLTKVDDECMAFGNCSDETIVAIMENAANSLTAILAAQAKNMIAQYGMAMASLYNMGYDPNTACVALALCSDGGGGEEPDPCPDCTNCDSTAWHPYTTGYETRIIATCDCGKCTKSTRYRCAVGYYGSSSNGTSGCTRCPSSGGVYGTSAAGATDITQCYIPADETITFSDSTGSGTMTFTQDCYYTK